jgi:hypothetical protein
MFFAASTDYPASERRASTYGAMFRLLYASVYFLDATAAADAEAQTLVLLRPMRVRWNHPHPVWIACESFCCRPIAMHFRILCNSIM